MPYYQGQGQIPAKHFTTLARPSGVLYYEELLSSEGFNGPASLLYRLRSSTRVRHVQPGTASPLTTWAESPVRNHRIELHRIDTKGDALAARRPLFFNGDLVYSFARPTEPGDRFVRNGYADELWLVAEGSGTLETMFGELAYAPLDLVCIPRGTTWRVRPAPDPHAVVVIETSSPVGPPAHYRNRAGQFLARSLYSERDLRSPTLVDPVDEEGEFTIAVKTGTVLNDYTVSHHPFDVVGWDGALYPYALNMGDIEPLSGRVHLMPDMHQVFASQGTMICAITPNRLPDHPDAYPAQADHSADCDEIFYRCASDGPTIPGLGTITLHPRAAAHGPKPGFEHAAPAERSHLFGLIIDAARPVQLTMEAGAADEPDYASSWT